MAVLGLALGSCAIVPPPRDADLPLPANWSIPIADTSVSGALAPDWWERFGDPRLSRLVAQALQANTDVLTAQTRLQQSRALRNAADASLRPGLSMSGSLQHRQGEANSGNLVRPSFDANWIPDLFGGRRAALRAAEADAGASASTLEATRVTVAAEVATSYLQWCGVQVRLAIARDSLQRQRQLQQIVQWRAQAGLASSLEVEQSRTAVEQAEAQVPALWSSGAAWEHSLAVLIGMPPATWRAAWAGTSASAIPQPPVQLSAAVPADALRQRPDVAAAEAQLEAARQRVAQAEAGRRASLQAQGSIAWSAVNIASLGTAEAARALLGSMELPLFDAGSRLAQRDAQQAEYETSTIVYRARVLSALAEVEDALSSLAATRERLGALRLAAKAADRAATLAATRYGSGVVDFQSVLETQRTLLTVQDGVAMSETDWSLGHVQLYKALGGGWQPSSGDKQAPAS